ncbi:unnamed protein product [Vitrella brassicaformis CCMP3155]|uniref:Uncharacterized protein n=1 Tax=Vitrella brassicaformis (strain CCMP3155) TaxID=1169540 RepID=A0A0G4G2Q3_VITBC|nr:unnamed protein product [Vitrella brassicaformis CCMP3155]|eukprot:CEM22143.1 unnamed protein product [Vitrella brassicaformis CCMP3155]
MSSAVARGDTVGHSARSAPIDEEGAGHGMLTGRGTVRPEWGWAAVSRDETMLCPSSRPLCQTYLDTSSGPDVKVRRRCPPHRAPEMERNVSLFVEARRQSAPSSSIQSTPEQDGSSIHTEADRQKRAALRPSQPPAPTTGNSDLLEGLKSFGHRPARSVCALSADEKHPTHHPPPTTHRHHEKRPPRPHM